MESPAASLGGTRVTISCRAVAMVSRPRSLIEFLAQMPILRRNRCLRAMAGRRGENALQTLRAVQNSHRLDAYYPSPLTGGGTGPFPPGGGRTPPPAPSPV